MTTQHTPSLSALITEFRHQVANYAILMRESADGAETVRNSYGPALEELQNPPAARSAADIAAALLYLLDFGSLVPADEAILRAAIAGLSPEYNARAKKPQSRQSGQHKGAVAG